MRTPSPPPKRFQYWMVPGSSEVLARPAPTGEEHPARAAAPAPASAPRKRVRREMGPFMCAVLHVGAGKVTAREPVVGLEAPKRGVPSAKRGRDRARRA